jgi:histidinol dehydrogenase
MIKARQHARSLAKKGAKLVQVGRKFVARGVASAGKRRKSKIAGRKSQRGTGKAKRRKSMRKAARLSNDVDVDTNAALSELDAHLDAIRSTVNDSETEAMIESISNKLLESLKEVHDAATGFYESIAGEIKESEDVEEDDERIAVGRHFEGIARDAFRVAEKIAEGEADLHDAADDLQSLSADLADVLEATKGIE